MFGCGLSIEGCGLLLWVWNVRSVTLPTDVRAQLCQFSGLVHSQIKISYLLINLDRKTCLKILQDLAFILILSLYTKYTDV